MKIFPYTDVDEKDAELIENAGYPVKEFHPVLRLKNYSIIEKILVRSKL